jgi:Cof subfamily protein (haloacid dehalogenase superfamily)
MSWPRASQCKYSAVISDVDGTLVTDDKTLTAQTRAAVDQLHANGIIFSIVSSRPPRGLRMLTTALGITAPIAGFNGGVFATASLSVISGHLLPAAIARRTVDLLDARRIAVWVFSGQDWLLRDPGGPYVGLEERTVAFAPTIVDEFGPALQMAAKIVGVSADFEFLARCERDLRDLLGEDASVVRSQPYYLDVTHPLANKGEALSKLAQYLSVPLPQIVAIGDGHNDIAMFKRSGLSIAMGNASAEVRQAADLVTDGNGENGFAHAIERLILGGAGSAAQTAAAGAGIRAW